MSKKVNASATHAEPTLEITQNLGDGIAEQKEAKTTEQLYADVARELASVNTAVQNGQDPTDTLNVLKAALTALNKRLMKNRVAELSALDVVDLYREYIPNPFAKCKGARPDKNTGLYALVDVNKYVPFESLDAANPTRKITQVGAWQKMVRILRYNMATLEIRENGKASSNIALTPDDMSYRKKIGWDVKASMNTVTTQLSALAAAILPAELCPKVMYKADAKQLAKAIMPEVGSGHDTSNVVKREAFFEQKLFAVIKTRMADGGYLYDDESAEAVLKASKKDGKVEYTADDVRKLAEKVGLTVVEAPAEEESAEN